MPPQTGAAIPAAPRKTLLEWIEHDDGHTTRSTAPVCDNGLRKLHAQIFVATDATQDAIAPPPGLHLAPLG